MYTDAHIHLFDCFNASGRDPVVGQDMAVCASAHSRDEFAWQEEYSRRFPGQIFLSFGIHPQKPSFEEQSFLELLVAEKKIVAIGECGFDVYTETFRSCIDEQIAVWSLQLGLAEDSGLPLIVHCRKALDRIFADSKRLKKISAVVFHGWGGSAREAESLLDRGVNGFFCAGKGLLRGDRSLVETIQQVPVNRILTETDAPYMQSKGELFSMPNDIKAVTEKVALLRNETLSVVLSTIESSFMSIYGAGPGCP